MRVEFMRVGFLRSINVPELTVHTWLLEGVVLRMTQLLAHLTGCLARVLCAVAVSSQSADGEISLRDVFGCAEVETFICGSSERCLVKIS